MLLWLIPQSHTVLEAWEAGSERESPSWASSSPWGNLGVVVHPKLCVTSKFLPWAAHSFQAHLFIEGPLLLGLRPLRWPGHRACPAGAVNLEECPLSTTVGTRDGGAMEKKARCVSCPHEVPSLIWRDIINM